VLAIPSMGAGYVMANGTQMFSHLTDKQEICTPFAYFVNFLHPHFESINTMPMVVGLGFAVVGFALSFALYNGKGFAFDQAFEEKLPGLYNFSLNRWYMDNVY